MPRFSATLLDMPKYFTKIAAFFLLFAAACTTIAPEVPPSRVLDIPGVNNFRDLGGYATSDGATTKWRTLYRSGELSRLRPAAQPAMDALALQRVIDFRSSEERQRSATTWNPAGSKPKIILLPIGGSAADWSSAFSQQLQSGDFTHAEMEASFLSLYASVPIDNAAEYAALFDQVLASQGEPLLFHCTAGKDRTGIGAALILSALDVPRATIMQDFMATNTTIDVATMSAGLAKIFSVQSGKEIESDAIKPMLIVEPKYLETSFAAIERTYGTVDNYLREAIQLTDDERNELKRILLE